MSPETLLLLGILSGAAIAFAVASVLAELRIISPLSWRRARLRSRRSVTFDYEYQDGTRSELRLDPEDEQSIERFLDSVREDGAVRGKQREPSAAR